jgi:hypothetical protein
MLQKKDRAALVQRLLQAREGWFLFRPFQYDKGFESNPSQHLLHLGAAGFLLVRLGASGGETCAVRGSRVALYGGSFSDDWFVFLCVLCGDE